MQTSQNSVCEFIQGPVFDNGNSHIFARIPGQKTEIGYIHCVANRRGGRTKYFLDINPLKWGYETFDLEEAKEKTREAVQKYGSKVRTYNGYDHSGKTVPDDTTTGWWLAFLAGAGYLLAGLTEIFAFQATVPVNILLGFALVCLFSAVPFFIRGRNVSRRWRSHMQVFLQEQASQSSENPDWNEAQPA